MRERFLAGRTLRVGGDENAKWFVQTMKAPTTRVTITNLHFAGAPTARGHIVVDGDHVIITDLTVFPRSFGHWAAIRWGVFGVLRLGVIRRTRIRALFGIRQKGSNTPS